MRLSFRSVNLFLFSAVKRTGRTETRRTLHDTWEKSSAGTGAGASFDFGAGNQGTFTGRVEQISDWSLVAREPEEGKAYTFWARETKLDFLGLGDMVRITYRGKLEENKPLSIVSVEKTEKAEKG